MSNDAKAWADDFCETIGLCRFVEDRATDPTQVRHATLRIQVRASRRRDDGCLKVTDSAGEWSAYFKPDANGRLILNGFSRGVPPGSITMTLDGERVLNHFAADLETDPNDA